MEEMPRRNPTTVDSLLKSSEVWRRILQAVSDSILIVDGGGRIRYACSQHPAIGEPTDLKQFLDYVHDQDRGNISRTFRRVSRTGKPLTIQYRYRSATDDWLWVESTGIPLLSGDEPNAPYIAVWMKDITERKKNEDALRAMAFHDPLTGLPNRRLFKEHLRQSLAQAKRRSGQMALLYLDIDDFKLINDTLGHEAGDRFLRMFAKRVRGCIREGDMAARMGGDEFTVLLPSVDSVANAEKLAMRIIDAVSAPWESHGRQMRTTVSVGVVVYPDHGESAASLLRNVDMALYRVKGAGRNHFQLYDPHMAFGEADPFFSNTFEI